jgi:phenylacetate-coenzyme A ligase PaaK-like adenylate-forming protein
MIMVTWYKFGEFIESSEITPEIIRDVVDQAKLKINETAVIPIVKIAEVLDRVRHKLSDPDNPVRKQILTIMPDLIHFSPEMVNSGIEAICENIKYDSIMKRLAVDLENPAYIEDFTYNNNFKGYIKAAPQGVLAHVSAGNVFVGAVDTLIQGIITKNVNILKMSSFDPVFPLLFAKLVIESDPEGIVYPYFALVPFRGGQKEIENIIKQESDVVIVYGGKDTVEAYRNDRGLFTKDVEFGPKYSCVIIDPDELARHKLDEISYDVARDFTMWEQSACSSPHSVFIKGLDNAEKFAASLKKSFECLAIEFPPPQINTDEQLEITRARELARVEQALGNSELIIPAIGDQSWTIILEKIPRFKISCQHRTAYIVVIDNYDQIFEALSGYGKYIQSVGIMADEGRLFDLSERLTRLGADRITELGAMSKRKHGTPHDGTRGLAEYVRWVSVGHDFKFTEPFDYKSDEYRDSVTLARLNHLLKFTRENSVYYSNRIPEAPLKSLAELAKIPVLSQEDFRSNLPPYGNGILTGPLGSSISFGSGGTSGKPKFVYRTLDETRYNASRIAKGLRLQSFKQGDVIANLFFAGNMWASFVSVNMALEEIGCHILPIGGNIGIENIMTYLTTFKIDGALSIPSILISIAQYVENNNIKDFKIPKLAYGGEHLSPAAHGYLKSVLGAEVVGSANYAINDTGVVGYQCEHCQGSVHHIHEDLHIVEIVDPDTFEPVADGQAGNIILTNINRKLMPVIRYDVGDRGRWIVEPCACGRKTRMFELLGRSDEVLIIGGDNISVDAISQAISQVKGLSQNFTMYGKHEGPLDLLEVHVEAMSVIDEKAVLADKLVDVILKEKPALVAFLNAKSISKPKVIVCNHNEIPRNPRTGKIKRVVEERYD